MKVSLRTDIHLRHLFFILAICCLLFPATLKAEDKKTDSEKAKEWLAKGRNLVFEKKIEQAMEAFNKAIELAPGLSMAYVYRGNAYDIKGEFERAMADYEKAIKSDPKNPIAYFERGIAYAHKGKLDNAIEDFSSAISLDKAFGYYYNRGLAYANKKMLDAALDDFTNAIKLNPRFAMSFYDRGVVLSEKGQHSKAIDDFTSALTIDRKLATAYHNRGIAYEKTGQRGKMTEDYKKAAHYYIGNGIELATRGDLNRAENFFKEAIDVDTSNQFGYYNMACLFSLKKDTVKACEYLEKAVAKGYDHWDVIKKDDTLDNIRNSECYRKITAGK